MTTLNGATGQTPRRHRHRTQTDAERCPYCGSPITSAILARIAEAEHARIAKAEQAITDKFARERAAVEHRAKTAIETAKRDATKAAQAQIRAFRADQEAVI